MDKRANGFNAHWLHSLDSAEEMFDMFDNEDWNIDHQTVSTTNGVGVGIGIGFTNSQDGTFLGPGPQLPPQPTLHYQNPNSIPMNTAIPTPDVLPKLISEQPSGTRLEEHVALRSGRLQNWQLDTKGMTEAQEADDVSCKSSPDEGSCPSHCGKPGQGSVCCNDDDCGPGTVCSDEHCDGAQNPCDDEDCDGVETCDAGDCMADGCSQTHPEAGAGPSKGAADIDLALAVKQKTRKAADEVAAAAALTSFTGNPPHLQNPNGFDGVAGINTTYFDPIGDPSFQNSPSSSQDRFFTNTHGSPFSNTFTPFSEPQSFGPCESNHRFTGNGSDMMFGPHSMGIHMDWAQQGLNGPSLAYISHVLNHHDPLVIDADHAKSCFVNKQSLALPTSCPLPHHDTQFNGLDHSANHTLNSACGFTIQDTLAFQEHLLSQHQDLKANLPDLGPCNIDWTCSDTFAPHFPNPWQFAPQSDFNFNHFSQARQESNPASSLKSATISHAFIPTPVSSGLQDEPGLQRKSRKRSRDSISSLDQSLPNGLERAPEHSSIAVNDVEQPKVQCQCMWVDERTEQPCGRWFDCAKELDDHCRHDHVRTMDKSGGGFRCQWHMCPRRNKEHFPQRGKLNRHLQVHTGLKPNICPYCGLAVSAKQALDQHMRLHTRETPYACPWDGCNQRFKQRSALTMHIRTHTGEKPLVCEHCGQTFRESSNLTKHRRTHEPKGMYECGICKRDFNRLDQLRRHLNSNHKDDPAQVQELLEKLKPSARGAFRRQNVPY